MRKILKILLQNLLSLLANIRKWDWSIILLCIFISSIVWIFNALNSDGYNTKIRYPLQILMQDSQVVALDPPPAYISVSVSGTGWSLLQKTFGIGIKPLALTLKNPIETKVMPTRALREDIAMGLRDVRLNGFLEDSLYFNYDSLIYKKVQVVVDTNLIDLEKDYRRISAVQKNVDSVTFYGPSTYIQKLNDTLPLQISKERIKQDFNQKIKVSFDDANGFISVNPNQINVSFQVALYTKRTQRIFIEQINFPSDSMAYIDEQKVILDYYIQESHKEELLANTGIKAIINFDLMNSSDSMVVPLITNIPPYIKDYQVLPPMLKIKFKEKPPSRRSRRQ
ncbi:MAG: hypothetical protein JJT94_07670 [Bernardetiaceae bacterium]|nr:hypothetical protein [Bernardetiaceae bacterium]